MPHCYRMVDSMMKLSLFGGFSLCPNVTGIINSMDNITTSWGETLPFTVEAEDAQEATFYIGDIAAPVVTSTAQFVDGAADVSVAANLMKIDPKDYKYQFSVLYNNGDLRKFPDSSCEDCELPTLTVCPTIDMEE